MVNWPNPPGSRQLISPLVAVLEIAPAKVLQGAVRLHGLTSSPTPDTQVRLACAFAGVATSAKPKVAQIASDERCSFFMKRPSLEVFDCGETNETSKVDPIHRASPTSKSQFTARYARVG